MRKATKPFKICVCIVSVLIIVAIIVINLPQLAGVRGTFVALGKDGQFISNAVDRWNKRQERIEQEERTEKLRQDFVKQRENERISVNKDANAKTFLITPTYDDSGQAVHPDILYFDKGFKGHKYWMAFTPYPDSRCEMENPSILVSDDGFSWAIPHKLHNPITPPPVDVISGGHNSDTDIIFADGKLFVYFVYNKKDVRGPSKFFRIESEDGINWSKPQLIYETKETIEGYSPAIIYSNNSYKMWYFGGENKPVYTSSKDGVNWDDVTQIDSMKIDDWRTWHIDVREADLGYEALICARKEKTSTRALFYASSKDGINWDIDETPVIYPSSDSWDSGGIYRSTFIKQRGLFRVWYSAYEKNEKWHIGYAEGYDIQKLKGMQ